MNRSHIPYLTALPFSVLVYFLISPPAYAESLGLSLSPPQTEILIQPGKHISQTYSLKNMGKELSIQPHLYEYTQQGIIPMPTDDPSYRMFHMRSPKKWGEAIHLKQNESIDIDLDISIPIDATPSTYLRSVVFRSIPPQKNIFSQSRIQQEIASHLFVSISTQDIPQPSIQLKNLSLPKIIDSFDIISVVFDIKNSSNIFTRVTGSVSVEGPVGGVSQHISPNILLPDITTTIEPLSTSGLFIGPYTISIDITDVSGNLLAHQTHSLLALPWKLLTSLLSVSFLWYVISRYQKRKTDNK